MKWIESKVWTQLWDGMCLQFCMREKALQNFDELISSFIEVKVTQRTNWPIKIGSIRSNEMHNYKLGRCLQLIHTLD